MEFRWSFKKFKWLESVHEWKISQCVVTAFQGQLALKKSEGRPGGPGRNLFWRIFLINVEQMVIQRHFCTCKTTGARLSSSNNYRCQINDWLGTGFRVHDWLGVNDWPARASPGPYQKWSACLSWTTRGAARTCWSVLGLGLGPAHCHGSSLPWASTEDTHPIETRRVDPCRAMPSSGTYSTAVCRRISCGPSRFFRQVWLPRARMGP